MVYRGCVLENNIDHIVVLTKDFEYKKLNKKGDMIIGREILFLEEDIITENKKSLKGLTNIAAAILLLILSTTLIFQFGFDFLGNYQTYAIVSVDINPSLQFEINEKEIVRKVIPLNKDGEKIIENIMVGMRIEEAVSLTLKNAIEKNYLNKENNVVLISDVIKRNIKDSTISIKKDIEDQLSTNKNFEDIEFMYMSSDKKNINKANDNRVSIGKYEIYESVKKNKPDTNIEDIKNKTITEIIKTNKDVVKDKSIKLIKSKENKIKEDDDNNKEKNREDNINKDNGKMNKENIEIGDKIEKANNNNKNNSNESEDRKSEEIKANDIKNTDSKKESTKQKIQEIIKNLKNRGKTTPQKEKDKD